MSDRNLPQIRSYGNYPSDNYDAHSLRIEFDNLTLWLSCDTIVAFRGGGYPRMVRQNDWGMATGKHLNAIDGGDKKGRIPGEKFETMLQDALKKLGLSN